MESFLLCPTLDRILFTEESHPNRNIFLTTSEEETFMVVSLSTWAFSGWEVLPVVQSEDLLMAGETLPALRTRFVSTVL